MPSPQFPAWEGKAYDELRLDWITPAKRRTYTVPSIFQKHRGFALDSKRLGRIYAPHEEFLHSAQYSFTSIPLNALFYAINLPAPRWNHSCYSTVSSIAGGQSMLDNFDIFRILPDGDPIWIKSVPYLEEARVQIRRLSELSPG